MTAPVAGVADTLPVVVGAHTYYCDRQIDQETIRHDATV
jgi:hypothetical protein